MVQNGITFTIDADYVNGAGQGVYTHSDNIIRTGGTDEYPSYQLNVSKINQKNQSKPAINCIDIKWNNAELPNSNPDNGGAKNINTTGDLLNLINEMQKEIYALTAAVIALANK